MILAVTGHRPDKLNNEYDYKGPVSKKIYLELERNFKQLKPKQVYLGMCIGVDLIAANCCYNLKIPYIACIPFTGQELKWSRKDRELYNKLISYASEVRVITNGGYKPWKMMNRNKYMVDHCDVLVAVWDGSEGGTGNTVNYAVDKNKDIRRIIPYMS